ncbi:DUF2971 domain-containing protein [Lacimicrobium alkaliphilum]|uniref:DUF2971 domain-containing protein n=1 Tax=Lacimicrobium alkaliphilum TaxID=1526571 RepID=A0ABQ1RRR4_9ALTE|nr:DUF2971 domain-containing protein [Lacimicrobium alkaliphilum]GGD79573.1 hypothetical protein GCM10011357_38160 [Lacimicrobium alkaliphilum]
MSLYHYTDINAVKSILENKELWLTHIGYMNDDEEFISGLERIADKAIGQSASEYLGGQSKEELVNQLIEQAQDENIFVCSFCQKADLLSQWRGYTPNNGGYAVEFDEAVISDLIDEISQSLNALSLSAEKMARDDEIDTKSRDELIFMDKYIEISFLKLDSCAYEEADKEALAIGAAKEWISMKRRENCKTDFMNTYKSYLFSSCMMKNKGFSEEKEKRLMVRTSAAEHHRCRDGIFVPYFKFKLPDSAIKNIWVGPSRYQDLKVKGLSSFLKSLKQDNPIGIKKSVIPLRT